MVLMYQQIFTAYIYLVAISTLLPKKPLLTSYVGPILWEIAFMQNQILIT